MLCGHGSNISCMQICIGDCYGPYTNASCNGICNGTFPVDPYHRYYSLGFATMTGGMMKASAQTAGNMKDCGEL